MTLSPKAVCTVEMFALAVVLLLPGCSRDEPPAKGPVEPTTTATPESPAAPATTNVAPATTAPATTALVATVDSDGRKWLTPEVPYDVFPDVPSDLDASDGSGIDQASAPATTSPKMPPGEAMAARSETPAATAPAATATEPAPSATEPAPTTPPMPEMADTPDGGDWPSILPLDVLRNEVATVSNDLGKTLLTVGSYNAAFEDVSRNGWLMSALATIVSEYPDPISWKSNALLARDQAVAVAMSATARGRKSFGEAQLANDLVAAIINNNTPAGLPDPDPAASREETADRAALMSRMQSAFDSLKEATADDAAFQSRRETALHEAAILAALTRFTAHSDYSSANEPDYQTAAQTLVTAGTEMVQAAEAEDPDSFKAAFDKVGTACNTCHEKYRFEN